MQIGRGALRAKAVARLTAAIPLDNSRYYVTRAIGRLFAGRRFVPTRASRRVERPHATRRPRTGINIPVTSFKAR